MEEMRCDGQLKRYSAKDGRDIALLGLCGFAMRIEIPNDT